MGVRVHVKFEALFEGRADAYGLVQGRACREPLTPARFSEHLNGDVPIGVYPMVNDMTHWGCSDIDQGVDMLVLATNLVAALDVLGIASYIERSKGKGYHVWVFLGDDVWIAAADMRRAILVAHQLAGVPPREVNPKQESLRADQLGNYVNLPFPRGYMEVGRRVILDPLDQEPLSLQRFLSTVKVNDPAVISRVAALYKEPPKPTIAATGVVTLDKAITTRLGGLAWKIFSEGPLPGKPRGTTMVQLAHECAACGLTEGEALAIITDFDDRFEKFVGRPDRERYLLDIVARGYA
jgi:hypothetical protein